MDDTTNTITDRINNLAANALKELAQLSREDMTTEERVRVEMMRQLLWRTAPYEIEDLILAAQRALTVADSAPPVRAISDEQVCSGCGQVFMPRDLDDDILCEPCAKAQAAMFAEAGIPWTPAPRGEHAH